MGYLAPKTDDSLWFSAFNVLSSDWKKVHAYSTSKVRYKTNITY